MRSQSYFACKERKKERKKAFLSVFSNCICLQRKQQLFVENVCANKCCFVSSYHHQKHCFRNKKENHNKLLWWSPQKMLLIWRMMIKTICHSWSYEGFRNFPLYFLSFVRKVWCCVMQEESIMNKQPQCLKCPPPYSVQLFGEGVKNLWNVVRTVVLYFYDYDY